MEIKTKYNVGDEVWYQTMVDGCPAVKSGIVTSIRIRSIDNKTLLIEFAVDFGSYLYETSVFPTAGQCMSAYANELGLHDLTSIREIRSKEAVKQKP